MAHAVVNPPPTDKQPFPQRKPVSKTEAQNVMRRISEDSIRHQQARQPPQEQSSDPSATGQMMDDPNRVEMIEFVECARNGKLPNNAQIERFLDRLLNVQAIQERKHLMSADGLRLLDDVQALLQSFKTALYVKNGDQLFQSLYYHLFNADYKRAQTGQGHGPNVTDAVPQQQMKKEGKAGSDAMYKVFKLIIMDSGFRELVSDLMSVAQEVFSDATGKLSHSTQHMSQYVAEQGHHLDEHLQDMAEQGQSRLEEGDYGSTGQVKQSILDRVNSAKENSPQAKDKTKRQMQEQGQRVKSYAHSKFPPEKVDEIVERLKLVLGKVQRHPDYQQAIDTIVDLVETWSYRATHATQSSAEYAQRATHEFRSDPNWSAAEFELKTIIEDWAQGRSLDPLLHAVETAIDDVSHDPDLKHCYHETTHYLRRLVQEPNYATAHQSTEDGKYLVHRMQELTEGRYRSHVDFLITEAKAFMKSMEDDPMARELEVRFRNIHNDLWLDAEGNTAFKPNLFTDIRMTLIPAAMELIKFIRVPAIEYSDKDFDLAIENLVLPGDTLFPGVVEVKMDNYVKFTPHDDVTNANLQSFWIKMHEIKTTVKDVVWYYKLKTGFPRMYDRGVATITIGGKRRQGMTVDTQVISDSNDPVHTFRVEHCKANIEHLKVKFKGSRHNLLYSTFQPMATSIIKRQIAKAVEAKITEAIENADAQFTSSMMKQYNEALAKNASWNDLASSNVAMQEQQQTVTSPVEQITSAVGANKVAPVEQQQQQQLQPETRRPSLTTAFVTILNRNIKSSMVRSIQDQQTKHRRRKAEKEAVRKEREQEQRAKQKKTGGIGMMMAGQPTAGGAGDTVSVIVGSDGKTYIANEQGQLVPVTISSGDEQQQQQQQPAQEKRRHKMEPSSIGKKGLFHKAVPEQEMGPTNQDIGYQHATAAAPNVM